MHLGAKKLNVVYDGTLSPLTMNKQLTAHDFLTRERLLPYMKLLYFDVEKP